MELDLFKFYSKKGISANAIRNRIKEMAKEITEFYSKMRVKEITVLSVLNGSFIFTADLVRQLHYSGLKTKVAFIRVKSYQDDQFSGKIEVSFFGMDDDVDYSGHVLIVDDIYDHGRTIKKVIGRVKKYFHVPHIKFCCLLYKKHMKKTDFTIDSFIGFIIPDEFVIGYGMDYNEDYRELPYIKIYEPEDENKDEESRLKSESKFISEKYKF